MSFLLPPICFIRCCQINHPESFLSSNTSHGSPLSADEIQKSHGLAFKASHSKVLVCAWRSLPHCFWQGLYTLGKFPFVFLSLCLCSCYDISLNALPFSDPDWQTPSYPRMPVSMPSLSLWLLLSPALTSLKAPVPSRVSHTAQTRDTYQFNDFWKYIIQVFTQISYMTLSI